MTKYIILFLILAIPLSLRAESFDFNGATSARVDVTPGAIPSTDAFTVWAWIYPTSLGASAHNDFMWSAQTSANVAGRRFQMKTSTAPVGGISSLVDKGSGTFVTINSTAGLLRILAWQFVALTYDGASSGHLYYGTLNAPITDVTDTGTSNYPAGTVSPITGTFRIGNSVAASPTSNFDGRIGVEGYHTRVLSLDELKLIQFSPFMARKLGDTSLKLLVFPGQNRNSSQVIDYSGNGFNGTTTSITISSTGHQNRSIFRR